MIYKCEVTINHPDGSQQPCNKSATDISQGFPVCSSCAAYYKEGGLYESERYGILITYKTWATIDGSATDFLTGSKAEMEAKVAAFKDEQHDNDVVYEVELLPV